MWQAFVSLTWSHISSQQFTETNKQKKIKKKTKKQEGESREKKMKKTPGERTIAIFVSMFFGSFVFAHGCNKTREFRREEAFQARCPDFRETMDLGTFPNVCRLIH